ncbi:MAG: sugar phosphate isomerase/epimerase [Thermoguttaceae bacterium]|jgi:inosose dehydratase
MDKAAQDRRRFLADAGLAAAAMICGGATVGHTAQPGAALHVAINQWSVGAIRGRDEQKATVSFDEELAELAASGINGLEPGLGSADQVAPLAAQLKKHGLELRSIYTGSTLDDRAKVGKEVERIVALAKCAKEAGTRIIVTNPSPLPNRQGKSDEQLKTQAAALDRLGHELAAIGVTLAYHNHDVELQHAAREFHHMMLATDPRALSLCLDVHWVYRGAGHSQVALFDVVKLYAPRVAELHLRQSTGNVWSETFGDGDIDYRALVNRLVQAGVRPLVVLEQGPEGTTPQTMGTAAVHQRSVRYVREVFARLAP